VTDPIEIKPTAAPLTDAPADHRETNQTTTPTAAADDPQLNAKGSLVPFIAVITLGLMYSVFFVLPDIVPAASNTATVTTEQPATEQTGEVSLDKPTTSSAATKPVTPFRDAQLARAKEQAEKELATFVELQIELEEKLQIASWGQTSYDAVKDTATQGDTEFVARDFEAALNSYRAATAALGELRDRGEADYQSAINAGNAAIADFNQLLAEREFNRALGYKAEDPDALAGLARAGLLPEIQNLLRKARQLARRGDTQAATATYREVLALDPQTPTVTSALAELSEDATNADFQDQLSRGFAALENGRYRTATTAFNAALKIKPGNAVAKGGLQQIAQETEVRGLRSLENTAAAAIAAEDWDAAVSAFDKALATDKTLEFAQAGRRDAIERQKIARGMNIIINKADNLSDNKRMNQARDLLAQADAMSSAGPKWDAAKQQAKSLIADYSQPVAVELTSDNATEVTVYKVGRLGKFRTHSLSLRPGAYTIVGTADRCQDVRREVIVRPRMTSIDIRCENRL